MKPTDDVLNLYVDGRLPPDEVRRVEDALADDAGLRERLEALVATREAIHAAFAESADLPGFDEAWAGVEARLDREAAARGERAPGLLERLFPGLAEGWAWLLRPQLVLAVGAAAVALVVTGLWIAGGADGTTPGPSESPRVASTNPDASPIVPGARRELGAENGRRGMVGEEHAPRSLAIVESYAVDRGVVVVSAPAGSAKRPLVIWHLVPGEELDDEEVMP